MSPYWHGTALLKPNQPGLGSHIVNAGFMVAASMIGRGVGRRLGEHIVARARALGYQSETLDQQAHKLGVVQCAGAS